MLKTKNSLLVLLSCVFVSCLLISNVMAAKVVSIGQISFTSGMILFPVVYIVNDLITEVYGYRRAKAIILTGFGINLFAVIAYKVAIMLPFSDYTAANALAFEATLDNTARVLLASFAAYIAGSLINAKIMEKMKAEYQEQLMTRCIASTVFGELADGVLFVTIAFCGILPFETIATMISVQVIFKTAFEVAVYPVTSYVIRKVKALPNGFLY